MSDDSESWRFNASEWKQRVATASDAELAASYQAFQRVGTCPHLLIFHREMERRGFLGE